MKRLSFGEWIFLNKDIYGTKQECPYCYNESDHEMALEEDLSPAVCENGYLVINNIFDAKEFYKMQLDLDSKFLEKFESNALAA